MLHLYSPNVFIFTDIFLLRITIEITPDGDIRNNSVQIIVSPIGTEQGGYVCQEPCIIKISDQIIAVAYREQGQGENHATGHPGYILTAAIVSDSIPPFLRGVFKEGSYGIFANLTTAVALINGEETLSYPISPREPILPVLTLQLGFSHSHL